MNSVSPVVVPLTYVILMVSSGVMDVWLGRRNLTTRARMPVYERICKMKDRNVVFWIFSIFFVATVIAFWLQGQDTNCVGDGGGQYSYEVCE